jgi:glycosyltransferase involved in cell wall biosynthesis
MNQAAVDNRRLLMVTHVVPYPPAAGNEYRINKLLCWLRDEGYQVILVLRPMLTHPIDAQRAANIAKLVHRLHIIGPRRSDRPALLAPVWDRAHAVGGRIRDGLYNRLGGRLYTRYARPYVTAAVNGGLQWLTETLPQGDAVAKRWMMRDDGPESAALEIEESICPQWFVDEAARLCAEYRPFAVMAQYIWMSRCLDRVPPGTLKLIDCHDLGSTRVEKVTAHGIDDPFAIGIADEIERLVKADVIIAIQDGERELLTTMGLTGEIITVGVDVEELPARQPPIPGRILCVAADNPPNVQGLRDFLQKSWPAILSARPGATLQVVGSVTRRLPPADRTMLSGFIPNLRTVYEDAQVVINPSFAGSGLKIKTLEALAHAKPLVAWPNGVDGLDGADRPPCLVASNWLDFANKVVLLLDDPGLREEVAGKARHYVRTHCHRHKVYGPLRDLLARESRRRQKAAALEPANEPIDPVVAT